MEILAYLLLFATYSYSVCKHILNTFAFNSYSLNCWTKIHIKFSACSFPFGPTGMSCNGFQWECLQVVYMVNGNINRLRTGMPRSPWFFKSCIHQPQYLKVGNRGGVVIFCASREGGCNFFENTGPNFPTPPLPVINDRSLSTMPIT